MRNGIKPVTIVNKPQWRLVGVAGERLPMKAKMIHRCIHVLDLEKSLAFYKRAFGLDVVREITRAEGSRKIVYIGNDTTDFELELVWESGRTEAYDNGSNDTHLAFAVDDVDAARRALLDLLAADSRVLTDPAPVVWVAALADSSVNLSVRAWVKNADYWDVFFENNEKIYKLLPLKGISFPFPQMDVHVKQN